LSFLLFFVTGCGSQEPAKSLVTGRVTYRGAPLKGGAIVFVPDTDRGNNGPLAKAAIREDGTFLLTADSNAVAAGWYRVAIAPKPAADRTVPTPSNPYPGPPARYRNPQLSGLNGEVKPNVQNSFLFELDDSDR
jgi:hypothetical protein